MAKIKTIAVTLSTGQQGSSVIKSILSTKSPNTFNIIGLARDPSSQKCQDLLIIAQNSKHSLQFVQCDIHKKQNLIDVFSKYKVWGCFCVTFAPFDGSFSEINDGKICIDAAIECNVSYFILSSLLAADQLPSDSKAQHVRSKYELEKYLNQKTKQNGNIFADGWLILRTTFYMENLFTFFQPSNGYLSIPFGLREHVKIAMVSIQNIGDIAASHFNKKLDCKQNNHSYDCIGDDISGGQMAAILSKVSGHNIVYDSNSMFMSVLSMCGIHFATDLLAMFSWYDSGVFHGNHEQCYKDLGGKRVSFEQFAERHFKNKDIGSSMTRKIIKYGSMLAVVGAVGFGVWKHQNKKK